MSCIKCFKISKNTSLARNCYLVVFNNFQILSKIYLVLCHLENLTNRNCIMYNIMVKETLRLRIRSKHFDGFDKEQRGLCMCLNQFKR